MDIVGLISGGKDSCYNLMCAVERGHRIVALAHLCPPSHRIDGDMDSYMYQTVGSEGVKMIAEAMELPFLSKVISGKSLNQSAIYEKTHGDEVEDLYELLKEVKEKYPTVKGVSVGAILSSYQKQRVEEVCKRLDLEPLCYLWNRNQKELLREMICAGVEAIVVKVAAIGLNEHCLGRSISELEPLFLKLEEKFGVHPCGEGGEYETFVTFCPLFKHKIHINNSKIVIVDSNDVSPVCHLRLNQLELVEKR